MATPGAEFVTTRRKASEASGQTGSADADLQALEVEIASHHDQPQSILLKQVVDRISLITLAEGAAIAICDQWGVVCRASVGDAPEVGSRLRPDSALTRECFETGQVVVCEDTETDYRVRRSTVKNLRLRSAVVVPLQTESSILGVIEVLSSRPSAFSAAHVAGLERIAELLAQIVGPGQVEPLPVVPINSPVNDPGNEPVDEPVNGDVLAVVPVPEPQPEERVAPPLLTVVPPAEPTSKRSVSSTAVVIAILLLLLLSLPYFLRKPNRQISSPSAPVAPAPVPPATGAPASQEQSIPPQSTQGQHPESENSAQPQLSAPLSAPPASASSSSSSSPSSSSSSPAKVESTTPSTSKPPAAENQVAGNVIVPSPAAPVIRPALPALVVQRLPTGIQLFVDDQLLATTDASGQASIPALVAGQHHLRLTGSGYRDYDQAIDVQAGKTLAIAPKLEARDAPVLNAPVLSGPSTPASVPAVVAAIPEPVTSNRSSPPNFALDRTLKAHSGWVTAVAFSPDGRRLVSGSWDRTVKFWEVSTGEQVGTVANKMKEIQALAFSRDGHFMATENSLNITALRDSGTGQEIRSLATDKPLGTLGSNWIYSIAFSPDGRWLASGIDDRTVRLWDVKTGQKVRDLTGLRRPVIYIAFSPDGKYLATGDDEKNVRIWDPSNGEQIYKLSGHKKPVYAVAFSSNSRWLASASADKTVKIWDLSTGHEIHTLAGHGNVVTSLAFSPDGHWLVSGSWDKTVKIWDVETGREIQTLTGHDHPIYSVAFDARGRWLATGSEDGTIKLWHLSDTPNQVGLQR
jgi:WD40 repeat protein